MLRLDELQTEINGDFFLKEELKEHNVKKIDALADIIIKPASKQDFAKLLLFLQKSGYPHIIINSKGRVVFPEKQFHGAVVVTDLKL